MNVGLIRIRRFLTDKKKRVRMLNKGAKRLLKFKNIENMNNSFM